MKFLFVKLSVQVFNMLVRDEGQDLIEYALILALIALTCVSGMNHISTAINHIFTKIKKALA